MLLLGYYAAQTPAVAAGSYDLLETEILTGSQASVTFSSLNSTYGADYQHLQIRAVVRSTRADTADGVIYRLNGDTAGNYSRHYLIGDGSSVFSGAGTSINYQTLGACPAATGTSGSFGVSVLDILDAFETSKYKQSRVLNGETQGPSIRLYSGSWRNTNAIDSITFSAQNGNIDTYSRISIYGLKAA